MLKYFKNISKNVIICYVISIITLLMMFVVSYAIFYNITPAALVTVNRGLAVAAFVIVGGACFLVSMYMKHATISSDENIYVSQDLSFYLKRVISLPLFMGLIGFGISFLGGVVFSFLLDSLTTLREDNFALFCAIVKNSAAERRSIALSPKINRINLSVLSRQGFVCRPAYTLFPVLDF